MFNAVLVKLRGTKIYLYSISSVQNLLDLSCRPPCNMQTDRCTLWCIDTKNLKVNLKFHSKSRRTVDIMSHFAVSNANDLSDKNSVQRIGNASWPLAKRFRKPSLLNASFNWWVELISGQYASKTVWNDRGLRCDKIRLSKTCLH